ncbi:unnamed protein product [Cunninghamella blakesleeana]
MSRSLIVTAVGAKLDKDGERFGNQDPYLRASLFLNETYQKTQTHKNAGKEPEWNNEILQFELNGEPDLFVEIMDDEKGVDAIIAYTTIPINQIVASPGAAIDGTFTVYDRKGEPAGKVHLILQAQGFQNSSSQLPEYPSTGKSVFNEDQKDRANSIHRKEKGSEFAAAAVLAAGLYFGKKYVDERRGKVDEE